MLNSFRDKKSKARNAAGRGKECLLCDPMVDLSFKREGAGETTSSGTKITNGMETKRRRTCKQSVMALLAAAVRYS